MRTTQQMSITLLNEMADVVKSKVRAGEYEWFMGALMRETASSKPGCARRRFRGAGLERRSRPHSRPTRSANSSRSAAKPRGKPRVSYAVVLFPEALEQLEGIEDYISHAGAAIAARYVDAIVASCINLADFPMRGRRRTI